jgi:large subunit ribosomal protein L3
MNKAIIGKKLGMTQIFAPDGTVIPVTVVQAGPCPVVAKKTLERDGYESVKVGFDPLREKLLNKPDIGQFKKAGVKPMRYLRELKFKDCSKFEIGSEIKVDIFSEGDVVDVTGTTKGRGFTGVIQRWNSSRGPMAHGSGFHRSVGSMGAHSDPSRVFKGKKLPGHYGVERVTIQNLKIAKVDLPRNVLLIKGGIPGAKNSLVIINEAVKVQKVKKPQPVKAKK